MIRIFLGILIIALLRSAGFAQEDEIEFKPNRWHLLDPKKDQVAGISLDHAYKALEDKPSETVLVAIIDSGFDIEHEDLRGKIWENDDEIEGNYKDDDNNGYIDDIHGWNFIGGKEENVVAENMEVTREYRRLKPIYSGKTTGKGAEYEYWLKVKKEFKEDSVRYAEFYQRCQVWQATYPRFEILLKTYLNTDELSIGRLKSLNSPDSVIQTANDMVISMINIYHYVYGDEPFSSEKLMSWINETCAIFDIFANYAYNPSFDPRGKIGDDFSDGRESDYGNNQVGDYSGPMGEHGTHVAGIIAANRNNRLGIDGIVENAELMLLRTIPNGDERDKDVANAIRYAVDNGAQVINMSFGKNYSPRKEIVYDAIKYAERKGILLIHAAGNESSDNDQVATYPNPFYKANKNVSNWIEVGAVQPLINENLPAEFSNYGKTRVDIFAPGHEIYSTVLDDQYEADSGPSMAAPVVTGVAGLLMSYFPDLSAVQVKEIIEKSSYELVDLNVIRPGSEEKVAFGELSRTGGIVNAYAAVQLAMEMTKKQ